ncbi:hypothetical protein FE391_08605 [Nonomuraea sp. KC401]|uniref:hypothetical protein n=1 Tax=unclassified Nonomuraea TaxID=2593643 RepID=UPI0010FD152B|nr:MULTISPECIES: hypothetical protein [unclassified Nonomuraea]NBE93996.1 hypothetical protein [Nonomuraea sp. K271]TLF80244.1 hypothetical protein FE391_08605 [Nonomuraea sp. KC401]
MHWLRDIDSDGEVLREWRLDLSCGPQVPERERRQAHRLWQQGSVHTTPDNHRLLLPQQTPAGETTLSQTGDSPAPATTHRSRL